MSQNSRQLYVRKLYTLLRLFDLPELPAIGEVSGDELSDLQAWWDKFADEHGHLAEQIGRASDRVELGGRTLSEVREVIVRHPISGQRQTFSPQSASDAGDRTQEAVREALEKLDRCDRQFWWLWRFYPELMQQIRDPNALLYPADRVIPDCPQHSYYSTVSALAGALFPEGWQTESSQTNSSQTDPSQTNSGKDEAERPYLLLFTFSPVQEFIKASRKFLDFWAGSYLLHYLSAKLCWFAAQRYGPDAIVTPSLWGQEIIDALMVRKFDDSEDETFAESFRRYTGATPVDRFGDGTSTSLSTAGFPNVITMLVPQRDVESFGAELVAQLQTEWQTIARKVQSRIRTDAIDYLQNPKNNPALDRLLEELAPVESQLEGHSKGQSKDANRPDRPENPDRRDLEKWKQECCWYWNKLWDAQIDRTWESYWTAVPLGYPGESFTIAKQANGFDSNWRRNQEKIAPSYRDRPTPTPAEESAYRHLNVGTWWGNLQSRLGQAIQAVKNTRTWQIPTAPGERSTLSGQFSAVHPHLNYRDNWREGGGVSSGSMQLFWRLMALVYPGLFDGSEKLNALELTKRMAWIYGGVAEDLGIDPLKVSDVGSQGNDAEDAQAAEVTDNLDRDRLDYETLVRFPNLSSIAAARFATEHPDRLGDYWYDLWTRVRDAVKHKKLTKESRQAFYSKTRRPFQVPNADAAMKRFSRPYNGAMFSSKWLVDDMGLRDVALNEVAPDKSGDSDTSSEVSSSTSLGTSSEASSGTLSGTSSTASTPDSQNPVMLLRQWVDEVQQKHFGSGSPADWWVIVAADGDGMGKYVSGAKLKPYGEYLEREILVDRPPQLEDLLATRKRMGPATHVGLNRALLDFSNRLIPYITEQRFCGKVVFSGGDDVLAVLPLADLPEFLLCLRSAWCGDRDPCPDRNIEFEARGGYWKPQIPIQIQTSIPTSTPTQPSSERNNLCGLPDRPLFTMGAGATLSAGIVVAHKSVPLPTVLEALWEAESDRAKKMMGTKPDRDNPEETTIPAKDGLCFRVIYGSGNILEATLKGHLLADWWQFANTPEPDKLSPVLYRLAEELPRHGVLTQSDRLLSKAAGVILSSRDEALPEATQTALLGWLDAWEDWAYRVQTQQYKNRSKSKDELSTDDKDKLSTNDKPPIGCQLADLAKLLRFTAFWLDKMAQQAGWGRETR
ncbi:MAG: type III-B CRISPR-associated protein Cas10/Cmr2 [Cyanobacteriota bacterium]|nr:type III-B CRISPR-associated protein Cas10/Cmr2 [Cyanobacteriota bacterium]